MQTCKIIKIKKIHVPIQPVYDITTEKNHNFILKNNAVLHNCDTGQTLSAKGYPYEILSVDRVNPTDKICHPYQYFKTTIYEKRLEIYNDKVLISEVTDLERNMNTGKVDHPDGGAKDKSDAVCGAIYNASKHAEEFAYQFGESNAELLMHANDMGRLPNYKNIDSEEQLAINMEEELKKMKNIFSGISDIPFKHPSDKDEGTTDYSLLNNDIIIY